MKPTNSTRTAADLFGKPSKKAAAKEAAAATYQVDQLPAAPAPSADPLENITAWLAAIHEQGERSSSSRGVYYLLAFLFGWLGLHKFYTGHFLLGCIIFFPGALLCLIPVVLPIYALGIFVWVCIEVYRDRPSSPLRDVFGRPLR